jgi:hypothetical protein
MWQTDGRTGDVSFVFKKHRCSVSARPQPVQCRDIRVPIMSALCAGGRAVSRTDRCAGGGGGGGGGGGVKEYRRPVTAPGSGE